MKLELSPEKTKICHLKEGFDFLGFHFTPTGLSMREKSKEKFRDAVRQITTRSRNLVARAIEKLNQVIRGTINYFAHLNVCNAFWHPKEKRISSYEKFKLLSITGGVPLYLEQIRSDLPAEQNIRKLCFTKGGLLVREFEEIFSYIFSSSIATHRDIISCLADGSKELTQICKELAKHQGGRYSKHLDELVKAGFVQRDFSWH